MGQEFDVIAGTKVADFVTSNNQFDYIQGPIGSGKTKAACVRIWPGRRSSAGNIAFHGLPVRPSTV